MPMYHIHTVPKEARRGSLNFWDYRYTVVCYPVSARNKTPVLWKGNLALIGQALSPASVFIHLKDCRRKNKHVTEKIHIAVIHCLMTGTQC